MMPSLIHQIDSADRPPAPTVANGVPLSVRSSTGAPNRRNVASNSGRTCWASVPWCMPWQRNTMRLYASEIVSGSQRTPSAVRNQPLKSAHHVSLGCFTEPNGCVRGGTCGRGLAPRDGQSGARQDRPTRARYRPLLLDAIGFVAYGLELLGSPTRMSRLGPQHRSAHLLGGRIGVMLRGA